MPKDSLELLDALKSEKYRVVKDGKTCYAMLSIHPLSNGHTMILPKRNVHTLAELTTEESKELLDLAYEMVQAIQKLNKKDCLLIQNYGYHSSIAHIHLHVLPSDADLRTLYVGCHDVPLRQEASQEKLTKMCLEVQKYLGSLRLSQDN